MNRNLRWALFGVGAVGLAAFALTNLANMPQHRNDPIFEKPQVTHRGSEVSLLGDPNEINSLRGEIEQLKHTVKLNGLQEFDKRLQNMEAQLLMLRTKLKQIQVFSEAYQTADSELAIALTPEEAAERRKAELDARIRRIDDRLAEQPIDNKWAKTTTLTVGDAFEQEGMEQFFLRNIDCRSTLCRLEIDFDPSMSAEECEAYLSGVSPLSGEVLVSSDDVNLGEAVMYMTREGFSVEELID